MLSSQNTLTSHGNLWTREPGEDGGLRELVKNGNGGRLICSFGMMGDMIRVVMGWLLLDIFVSIPVLSIRIAM